MNPVERLECLNNIGSAVIDAQSISQNWQNEVLVSFGTEIISFIVKTKHLCAIFLLYDYEI